jgi:dUTP pyrophosphatase
MKRTTPHMQNRTIVRVVRLAHAEGLPLPAYQTEGAAGLDLTAAIQKPLRIARGKTALVPTGLVMALPSGFEAQVRPRSGLAFKSGVTVLNAPGTIDADYRGEVRVLLINLGSKTVVILRGDRIAQMVVAPVTRVTFAAVVAIETTARGAGGFGSTGRRTRKSKVSKPPSTSRKSATKKRAQALSYPRRVLKTRTKRRR